MPNYLSHETLVHPLINKKFCFDYSYLLNYENLLSQLFLLYSTLQSKKSEILLQLPKVIAITRYTNSLLVVILP